MKQENTQKDMKNKLTIILLLLSVVTITTAQQPYREKYAAVLDHYRNDSLRYAAAIFLIDNMDGHMSADGHALNLYSDTLHTMWARTSPGRLDDAWKKVDRTGKIQMVPDSSLITPQYLIDNIDFAVDSWKRTVWKDSISFSQFCEYVLPYRVGGERISDGWRKVLYEKYSPYIKQCANIKEAFSAIYKIVNDSVKYWTSVCPYTLDVLTYEHIKRASCYQECLLTISILRSLCIPAALDGTPVWADYSTKGHSWVSLVMEDGSTYTIFGNETEPSLHAPINASVFECEIPVSQNDVPQYQIKFKKSISKVYRVMFSHTNTFNMNDPRFIRSSFAKDVSGEYGLAGTVSYMSSTPSPMYLCTFMTGNDWVPIAKSLPREGLVSFMNIGDNIVYLPVVKTDSGYVPMSMATYVCGREKKLFSVNYNDTCTISVDRKYPLCSYTASEWLKHIGGCIEASNDSDFANCDTLYLIDNLKSAILDLMPKKIRPYRYIRYKSPQGVIANIAEFKVFATSGGKEDYILGENIFEGVKAESLHNICDNSHITRVVAMLKGYWVGYDFGAPVAISRINLVLASDGNNVEQGHHYELYCWDSEWKLLGQQDAYENTLTFHGVPQNALFLLKDRTGGHEERIFEYKNGIQIWH